MIGAGFVQLLGELAVELARLAAPITVAEGTAPGTRRRAIVAIDPPTPPGLMPCPDCSTLQRPGAVHFATLTDQRPCPASWRRG